MNLSTKQNTSAGLPGFRSLDLLFLLVLFVLVCYYLLGIAKHPSLPAEDAIMILRYAQHLSQGHGIVYNIGDPPVDGATDFLFVIAIACVTKAGLSVEIAARSIIMASHLLTVLLVYAALRKLHNTSPWFALFAGIYLAVGPALAYIAALFGTPFYALFVTLAWCFATRMSQVGETKRSSIGFAFCCLGMTLTRPDGFLLSLGMLLSLLYWQGLPQNRQTLIAFCGVIGGLGGAYFLWHWRYFGYPLPNPYYIKGHGLLHLDGLRVSLGGVKALCGVFLPIYLVALWRRETRRQAVFSLIPVVGFSLIWILISSEMNWWERFQYAVLPIVLLSTPPLLERVWEAWRLPTFTDLKPRRRLLAGGVCVLLACPICWYQRSRYPTTLVPFIGLYRAAQILQPYHAKGYTIAVSEAGLMPFYSEWRSIDLWGLNNSWIAHHGLVSSEYLDRNRPQVILFHAYSTPLFPVDLARGLRGWNRMIAATKAYVRTHRYTLVGAWGWDPREALWIYVADDFPESQEIIQKLHTLDYDPDAHWVNYATRAPGR